MLPFQVSLAAPPFFSWGRRAAPRFGLRRSRRRLRGRLNGRRLNGLRARRGRLLLLALFVRLLLFGVEAVYLCALALEVCGAVKLAVETRQKNVRGDEVGVLLYYSFEERDGLFVLAPVLRELRHLE